MDVTDGLGMGQQSGRQVSIGPDPAASHVHRAWLRVTFWIGSFVLLLGGVNGYFHHTDDGKRIAAAVVAVLGVPGALSLLRRAMGTVHLVDRLRRGVCVHCGYDVRGVTIASCPECGRDPY